MPTPVVSLSALTMVTPQLALGSQTISVDSSVLPFVVEADVNTTRLEISIYNQTHVLTTFTTANNVNTFTTSVPLVPSVQEVPVIILGRNYNPQGAWASNSAFAVGYTFVDPNGNVQVCTVPGTSGGTQPTWATTVGATTTDGVGATQITWTCLGPLAITPTFKFSLIFFQSNLAVQIGPPSGLTAGKDQTDCTLQWATPTFNGFIGVRVMLSTDSAGINPPYTQFGELVNNVTSSVNTIVDSETSTTVNGNTTTVTTVNTTLPTNYSSVNVPNSFIQSDTFYALFSTVIQDPGSGTVYESQQSGPLQCGYVNLKLANPTDFPYLQRKEDIAGRLIAQINKQQPDLDLSPRSEIRDVVVDPIALELSQMSVREWFARDSTSISAISQIDDANGDGVSDPFNSSQYKQQIARAFGLNAQNTQNLIDTQFNLLGEAAGLTRNGATTATGILTFYVYTPPTADIVIPENATVATVADANTPALNFLTRGSAVLDVANLASFYNPVQGWWAITVPAECSTAGSIGNVGAGTIRQVVNGLPAGVNVTNTTAFAFGTDIESNSSFAARIQLKNVTGVDTGTRHGYEGTALATPGIIAVQVVAAGDVDMLRDWDPIRQKHVFGTVDIYTRGTQFSQQDSQVPFEYGVTGNYGQQATYLQLTLSDPRIIRFTVNNFSSLPANLYSAVELAISRGTNTFYLGLERAQFDNVNGNILVNPNDLAYVYVGSNITQAKVPYVLNQQTTAATNLQAVATIIGVSAGTYTISLIAREQTPLSETPSLQPIISISSVTGESGETGNVDSSLIELIHTSDFLLEGGSQNAGDVVEVSTTSTVPTTSTITALLANPVQIDTAMLVPTDLNGVPQNVLSVRSTDQSTLYQFGVDYNIVVLGPYHAYGLNVLTSSVTITQIAILNNVLTVTCNNVFGQGAPITLTGLTTATFLNNQVVTIATASPTQFTAVFTHANYGPTSDTGIATGSAIQNNQNVLVSYNKFVVYERLQFISDETQVLTGTLPTPLDNAFGFVHNTWLPQSYLNQLIPNSAGGTVLGTALTLDGWDGQYNTTDGGLDVTGSTGLVGALIPIQNRYIKVTFNGKVMRENLDFTLTQDATGAWNLARIATGSIANGGTVIVSYFTVETFTISTLYPAFVQILVNQINQTKAAAADVLVKAMVASPVDLTIAVTLQANASADVVDQNIRTAISIVFDNASGTLDQSTVIAAIQAVNGVQSVEVPFLKMAKSDASYDIGVVIPTGTAWMPLIQDPAFAPLGVNGLPANSFITTVAVLPDTTIPSGGESNAVVSLLYQGQQFRRASSVQDFLTNSPAATSIASTQTPGSFYIFGVNDEINSTTPLGSNYDQRIAIVIPNDVASPGLLSYFCTYQVFDETGTKDITVSSTEYLTTGKITISYIQGS